MDANDRMTENCF